MTERLSLWIQIVDGVLLPVALAFIMFSIGLALRPSDFRRVLRARRALVAGTASMLLLVPAAGVVLALGASAAFDLPPAMTVGLILLATCPSGILSNVLTLIARGDVALSISISVTLSTAYILLLPLLLGLLLPAGLGDAAAVPLAPAVVKILGFTLLPVSLGMLVRAAAPARIAGVHGPIRTAASALLFVMFAFIVLREREVVAASIGALVFVIAAMNLVNLAIALAVGAAARLSRAERRTLVVEHLIRQEGTAIFVAVSVLGSAQAAVPMILNTFIGLIGCGIAVFILRGEARPVIAPLPAARAG